MLGTPRKDTSHILRVFDLTLISRSQRSKLVVGIANWKRWHVLLWLMLLSWNFTHMYPLVTATHRQNRGPISFLVWPPGGVMWKHKKCNNSLNNGRSSLKFLWWVLLGRTHHTFSAFLIWPWFQGHRGQNRSSASPIEKGGTFCNSWCYWAQIWRTCSPS